MIRRPLTAAIAASVLALGAAACGSQIDLSKALTVTDVFSGYYDDGLLDGKSHMVPSITFKLKNVSPDAFNGVQLTVAFWREGADGENDSVVMRGIGSESLASGASTAEITARAPHGFTVEGARADMFTNSVYSDMVAKIFGVRGGKHYRLGEFKIDRVIIPHVSGRP